MIVKYFVNVFILSSDSTSSITYFLSSISAFSFYLLLLAPYGAKQNSSKDSPTLRLNSHVGESLLLCLMLLPIEPDFLLDVLWLLFGLLLLFKLSASLSTKKREAHCCSLHILRSSNLPICQKRATRPHADMYRYTPIEPALLRELTYERYVYYIPIGIIVAWFRDR